MKHKQQNLLELHNDMQANSEVCSMVYHGDWLVRERIECLMDMGIDYQNQHESADAIHAVHCGIKLLVFAGYYIDRMVKSCGPNIYFINISIRLEYPGQVLIKKTKLLVQLVNKLLFGRYWKQKGVSLQIQGVLEKHKPTGGDTDVHWHLVVSAPESHPKTKAEVLDAFEKAIASLKLLDDHGRSYFTDVNADKDEGCTDEHWCNYICKNLLHYEVLADHDQWGAGFYDFKHDDLMLISGEPKRGLVAMPAPKQKPQIDPMERKLELLNQEVFMATRVPWVVENPYSKHSDVLLYLEQPDLQ